MSSQSVLLHNYLRLIVGERGALASIQGRIDRQVEAAVDLAAELATMTNKLKAASLAVEGEIDRITMRLNELEDWSRDPVVLVRTSVGGYGTPVFHDAKDPCGYMWNRANFVEMLLGEALAEGHPPCTACGWRATRLRDAA